MLKAKLILPFIAIVLLGSLAGAQTPSANVYCDMFFQTLAQTKATTVDSFLLDLSRSGKMFQGVSSKVLMYNSRARHGSSLQNPRALIMYGASDLVLAFNGERSQASYDTLEMMCYNRSVGEFQFRAIQFLADAQPTSAPITELEISNSTYRMTKANPDSCKSCHNPNNTSTRPAWGTYLAWAGAYGSYEEAYNIPSARFAVEHSEYPSLLNFMKASAAGKERYDHFYWGGTGTPNLSTVNNAFFGILLNYKMANMALRKAIAFLKQPEKAKYRYAFAGYLLHCDSFSFLKSDTDALRPLRAQMATSRARFEIRERMNLGQDLVSHAKNDLGATDSVEWKPRHDDSYPIDANAVQLNAQPQGLAAMVARVSRMTPDWLMKLGRFEYLYKQMGLSSDSIHLGDPITPNALTSWDGYNEIEDYMADYIYRYYGFDPITPAQQLEGEQISARAAGVAVVHRADLTTNLMDADYESVEPDLNALQLPKGKGTSHAGVCAALAAESASALNLQN